jgi:hypothetical protein
LFPLFSTGVVDTGGKFTTDVVTGGNLTPGSLTPATLTPASLTPASLTPAANLPSVSTTQAELVAKFAACVVDTGGKFAANVVDTAAICHRWCTLTCGYLREFFEKNRNDPNVIFRGFRDGDSQKNLKQQIS